LVRSHPLPQAISLLTRVTRDRTNPSGYKVSSLFFSSGSPTAARNSTNSTIDIFSNADNSQCPDSCFRPVGLALDSKDRLWVSSDATGELYVLAKTSTATATASGASPTATKKGDARRNGAGFGAVVVGILSLVFAALMM
jgi:hypothetical protein